MINYILQIKETLLVAALFLNIGTLLYVYGKWRIEKISAIGREMIYGFSILIIFIAIAAFVVL
jgi:formate hydrogenlyase subunit 3/multisubunit Na+/H+ antiporter MnhD subunit